MELVEGVHGLQVDNHLERYGFLIPLGMPHVVLIEVEQPRYVLSSLIGSGGSGAYAAYGKLQGVGAGRGFERRPVGVTVFVYGTQKEAIRGFGLEIFEQIVRFNDGGVQHIVEHYLIVVGPLYLVPIETYAVTYGIAVLSTYIRRRRERTAIYRRPVFGCEYETVYRKLERVIGDIVRSHFY